ncbi:MAG: DUF6232 family protein [Streptosporangiaceae bacterium]
MEVQVKDRVLWIGSDAYPVNNIARTQMRELTFKRKPAWGKFWKSILKWLAVAIVATLGVAALHLQSAINIIWLVMLVIFIVDVIRLFVDLSKKDQVYYALVIETSGASRTPLVTKDNAIIYEIIDQVMRAINGEAVRFLQQVSVVTRSRPLTPRSSTSPSASCATATRRTTTRCVGPSAISPVSRRSSAR